MKQTQLPPDVLYMIRARLDAGRSKGAPQLTKDIRVLGKAADEIVRLRAKVAELDGRLGQRPCQHTRCAAYLTTETERARLRTRIECLRGALKTASGRFFGAGDTASADDCLAWAGDMESPLP